MHKIFQFIKRNLFPILIGITFILSRVVVYKSGIQFDASGLNRLWQYLDSGSLQNDLVRSIFYLHSQPPLFNIFLGVVLKLFPDQYNLAFAVFYNLCGLSIYFLLFKIFCLSNINLKAAYLLATVFIISPEAILYENWLFYTYPIAALLTFAAYLVLEYEKTKQVRYAILFLLAIAAVCWIRSTYHLVYLLICILLILFINFKNRKLVSVVSLCVVLGVSSVYFKNLMVFGFFGTSSWMGMNLWRIVPIDELPSATADRDLISVGPFKRISRYPEEYRFVPSGFSTIPVLTNEYKGDSVINFNHFGYIRISQQYLQASLANIAYDPTNYVRHVFSAWGIYCKPSWDENFLSNNREKIFGYIEVISGINLVDMFGQNLMGIQKYWYPNSRLLTVPIAFFIILVFISVNLFHAFRKKTYSINSYLLIFLIFTILYTAVLGNCVEYGENNRFRVETDPLLYIATLLSINALWQSGRGTAIKIFRLKINQ